MTTPDNQQNYYFFDYHNVQHFAASREEAETLRDQVGGGYAIVKIAERPDRRSSWPSACLSNNRFSPSHYLCPQAPLTAKDRKIYFFLCDYGRVGLKTKATAKTAHLISLVLTQQPFSIRGKCSLETNSFKVSLNPVSEDVTLVSADFCYETAKLLWSLSELLEAEKVYLDSWGIERSSPLEEWELWTQGIDPINCKASINVHQKGWTGRKSQAQGLMSWTIQDDEVPSESLEDLAWARECGLQDADAVDISHLPLPEDEETIRHDLEMDPPSWLEYELVSDYELSAEEEEIIEHACPNGVVVRAQRRTLEPLMANTKQTNDTRLFTLKEVSAGWRTPLAGLSGQSVIEPMDYESFEEQDREAEALASISEDAAAAWEEIREADESGLQLQYDESEDYGWDTSGDGDYDNFWNAEGRLEEAVNDIYDQIERRCEEAANESDD